jgi:hypothetical protein
MLGASLHQALGALDLEKVDLTAASLGVLESIWKGDGRIRVTLNGVVGDSGLYSGTNLAVHPNLETRERLVSSQEAFEVGITSRDVVRQTPRQALSLPLPCTTMFIGLDNADLLPPFCPAYRNEDGLFGLTLVACFDNPYACHLPWVMLHAPLQPRQYQGGPATIRVSDVLAASIESWQGRLPSQRADHRMRLLGAHVEALGSMDCREFQKLILALLQQRALALVAQRESLLYQHAGHPVYWASHLRKEIEVLLQSVEAADMVPVDLVPHRPGSVLDLL